MPDGKELTDEQDTFIVRRPAAGGAAGGRRELMGGERPLRLMGTGRLAGNVPLTRNLTGNENTVRRGQDPALRYIRKRAVGSQNRVAAGTPSGRHTCRPYDLPECLQCNMPFAAGCRAGSYPAAGTLRQASPSGTLARRKIIFYRSFLERKEPKELFTKNAMGYLPHGIFDQNFFGPFFAKKGHPPNLTPWRLSPHPDGPAGPRRPACTGCPGRGHTCRSRGGSCRGLPPTAGGRGRGG